MTETVIAPDERAFRAHIESARFQSGIDDGRWRLVSTEWPIAFVAVAAASREGAPDEYVLRFELAGYPEVAPSAGAWDPETGTLLAPEHRPKGGQADLVFRSDWENGRALYAPYDRVAVESHGEDWANRYPLSRWTPRRDLTFFLSNVFDVLNDDEYLGA